MPNKGRWLSKVCLIFRRGYSSATRNKVQTHNSLDGSQSIGAMTEAEPRHSTLRDPVWPRMWQGVIERSASSLQGGGGLSEHIKVHTLDWRILMNVSMRPSH